MVHRGPRPPHRKGTVGRPWRRYRSAKVDNATHCQNPTCGKPLVRDAPCPQPTWDKPNPHPNHRALGYCPTYHAYPTLEHPHRLVDGGTARDPDGLVFCYQCNSRGGRARQGARIRGQQGSASRVW